MNLLSFYGGDLNNKFNNLVEVSVELADNHNKPTLAELTLYKNETLAFIKKRKRIIYGGTAIHYALMEATDGKDGLYTGTGKIDYDFYTPDPIGDSIDLCNLLFDKGFPYVKRNLAISGSTYRIQVNTNIDIADVSYCPQWLFDKLPTLKTKEGLLIIHPDMLRLDMYKAMNHIPHDLYRFRKDYTRLMKLEQYYPMRAFRIGNDYEVDLPVKTPQIIDAVLNYVCKNQKEIILTGDFAYNFYISTIPRNANKVGGSGTNDYSGKLVKNKIRLLSMIVIKFHEITQKITELIKTIITKHENLRFDYRASLLKIIGKSLTVYYKDTPIIIIHDARIQVIPYIRIPHNDNAVKITDYYGTLAFYHIMKIINSDLNDEYTGKIVDLKTSESKYKSIFNPDFADAKNPFHIITTKGLETYAKTSEPHFKFSGKILYIPEVAKITADAAKNKEYYEKVVDPEIGGGIIAMQEN
jgi:hypothetical protein